MAAAPTTSLRGVPTVSTSPAPTGEISPSAEASPSTGTDGSVLPAGSRDVLAEGGTGWIASQPASDRSLTLTKMSLASGEVGSTSVIVSDVHQWDGTGLASDGKGNLWVGYGSHVVRVDEATRAVSAWDVALPEGDTFPDPSDLAPASGLITTAAWDPGSCQLLFLRSGSERLYAFDPETGHASVRADLGFSTTRDSTLVVASNGDVGVSGFTVSAGSGFVVDLLGPKASLRLIADTDTVLPYPSGLLTHGAWGLLSHGDSTGLTKLADLSRLGAYLPMTTDLEGSFFQSEVADGELVVTRVTAGGAISSVRTTLPGDPGIVALLPDQSGGVWLVSYNGTVPGSAATPSWPSLQHVRLPKE
jgi:hypothetical protein